MDVSKLSCLRNKTYFLQNIIFEQPILGFRVTHFPTTTSHFGKWNALGTPLLQSQTHKQVRHERYKETHKGATESPPYKT